MIITTYAQFLQCLDKLKKSTVVTYDIETDGLNVRTNRIIGFGVGLSDTEGFYLPLQTWSGQELEPTSWDPRPMLNILGTKQLVCHNAYFDIESTRNNFGIDLTDSIHADTILLKHTVDENPPFQLKEIAAKLYGADSKKEQEEMKESIKANGGTPTQYYKADMQIMAKYCVKDCLLTYKIYNKYMEDLEKEGLMSFFFNEEVMPLLKEVVIPMQRNGIPLDMPKLQKAKVEILQDLDRLEAEINQEVDPLLDEFKTWYLNKEFKPHNKGVFGSAICEVFNLPLPKTPSGKHSLKSGDILKLPDSPAKSYLISKTGLWDEDLRKVQMHLFEKSGVPYMLNIQSKHHLKKIFFEKLDLPPISRTDKGSPQADDDFLKAIQKDFPWVEKLVVYNRLQKIYGTYISRFLEKNESGKFHPAFFQHRTTSGRLGGDLMQLPRERSSEDEPNDLVRKYNNLIRELFIAGPKKKFIDADYNSLEVVVFADDSEDKELLDMIRNGEDFYSKTAIDVFNLNGEFSSDKNSPQYLKNHKPELRQDAKVYALGIRYGMKPFKLSKTLDIPEREAKNIINKYYNSYPNLKLRMDQIVEDAKILGFVKSKAGRVRHMPMLTKLARSHGDILLDGLELWKRYHEDPAKYKQMKHLKKLYNGMINNALNFPIQSMAASITNQSSIALSRSLKQLELDAYICLNVHDQLVVRCDEKDVETVKDLMERCMEQTIKLSVPLRAKPEVGDNMRETH